MYTLRKKNPDYYKNFEIMRAIVRELSSQVQWGPIGNDEKLTAKLRTAFHRHKHVFDYFDEIRHSRPDLSRRNYYFLTQENLCWSQIKELHQFVVDYAEILLEYSHIRDVVAYSNFANNYMENFVFLDNEKYLDVIPTLQTLLQTSKTLLEKRNNISQQPLFNISHFFTEKKTYMPEMANSRFEKASMTIAYYMLFSEYLQKDAVMVSSLVSFAETDDESSLTAVDNESPRRWFSCSIV